MMPRPISFILILAVFCSQLTMAHADKTDNDTTSPIGVVKTFFAMTSSGKACEASKYTYPADLAEIKRLVLRQMKARYSTNTQVLDQIFGAGTTWDDVDKISARDFYCKVLASDEKGVQKMSDVMQNMQFIGQIKERDDLVHVAIHSVYTPQLSLYTRLGREPSTIEIEDIATTIKVDGKWYMLFDQNKLHTMRLRYGQ